MKTVCSATFINIQPPSNIVNILARFALLATIAIARAGAPDSPRLVKLQNDLNSGVADASAAFWREIQQNGAPLVEPSAGNAHERLVTFLYRSAADVRVLILCDFADYEPHMELRRLGASDVWYSSFKLPDDSRFLYEVSVDDPAFPFVQGATVRFPEKVTFDALNPKKYLGASPRILSLVELPAAPPLPATGVDNTNIPRGSIKRFGTSVNSKILKNEHPVFIYEPPGYANDGPVLPLLLFSANYLSQVPLPAVLDRLIYQKQIPPVVAVFIDYPPGAQDREMGGSTEYADFVATELIPQIRAAERATADPKLTIIGGASAGGLGAAFVALRHPEVFGNVLAQSGAFWRGLPGTAHEWGDPARDADREGLARYVARSPAAAVRFMLTIGRLETSVAFSADGVSMLHASRHLRDVLEAKNYKVDLVETGGGHDPYNWESSLPDALIQLLGGAAASKPASRPGVK
ncbi:MAG: DUF3327 domain-containing protein [Planctomycetes bacterium]|nr:DUF3327 domain-containing protein [Planctomycetota bacterium]